MTSRALALALSLSLLGCQPERPPPVPIPEGGIHHDAGPRRDGGPISHRDAGPPDPIVDGEVSDSEWEGATIVETSVTTDRPGSTLHRLRAILQPERLVVAVEGTIADGDAIVIYVDRDLGASHGVSPASLADTSGTIDVALSQGSLDVPSGFRADFGWGTAAMPHTAAGTDDEIGWRDVASDVEHFTTLSSAEGPSVCSGSACEAEIPLELLGGSAPRTIALFARIVSADGGLTNQTLPEDDPTSPQTVRELLTIDDGVMHDGGVPDAGGMDGGAPGIVVDGIVDPDEWAGASVSTNTTEAIGTFAGDALVTLRAVRESTRLVVAIEGSFASDHAMLMYVDHDLGGPDGLVSPTLFNDLTGELDRAISKTINPADAELRIDFAWGTLDMERAAGADDDRMGWREVGTSPDMFSAVSENETACSASACETAISLSALGVASTADIALFVRLGTAVADLLSNQTLPEDDPATPETVASYLVVPATP